LKDCTEQRNLSVEQIKEYLCNEHIIDSPKVTHILLHIEQLDFNDLERLQKAINNTSNISHEADLLLRKEFQRRRLVQNLTSTTERGFMRKTQEPWYKDSPRSRSTSI